MLICCRFFDRVDVVRFDDVVPFAGSSSGEAGFVFTVFAGALALDLLAFAPRGRRTLLVGGIDEIR